MIDECRKIQKNEAHAKFREKNRIRLREKQRQYYHANKEKCQAYNTKYRMTNKGVLTLSQQRRRHITKELNIRDLLANWVREKSSQLDQDNIILLAKYLADGLYTRTKT